LVWFKYNYKNWMHSFEISLGYESVELHFQHEAVPHFIENVLRSTPSYPSETSKECIQFLIIIIVWKYCPHVIKLNDWPCKKRKKHPYRSLWLIHNFNMNFIQFILFSFWKQNVRLKNNNSNLIKNWMMTTSDVNNQWRSNFQQQII
jgi:hypothetical protein